MKKTFSGKLYTQFRPDHSEQCYAEANGITAIRGKDEPGLGRTAIHFNGNSGAQAINLAASFLGAEQIVLLGYDMQNTGGRSHWFGDHPKELANGNYSGYVGRFNQLASDLEKAGIEVLNCTRQTALRCFKQAPLEKII